jgi:hypothetical protein
MFQEGFLYFGFLRKHTTSSTRTSAILKPTAKTCLGAMIYFVIFTHSSHPLSIWLSPSTGRGLQIACSLRTSVCFCEWGIPGSNCSCIARVHHPHPAPHCGHRASHSSRETQQPAWSLWLCWSCGWTEESCAAGTAPTEICSSGFCSTQPNRKRTWNWPSGSFWGRGNEN